ncbi:MAG: carbohydrate kinase [Pseudomonadota bacterium]
MTTALIDIGKTNAKVAAIAPDGTLLAERRRPNTIRPGPPYPHFDVDALWSFVLDALGDLARYDIHAIVPVTHGACAALLAADGTLALPILDYEHDGPEATRASYAPPPVAETGSPPMPGGLNLGAQLHWLETQFPTGFARARHLLTWPQYWAFRLSGVMASEVTSLGCHTDLWAAHDSRPSTLARARGWDALLPPLRRAADTLGPLRADIAADLAPDTRILTGIHDSNASLLPYLDGDPCAVVSTGTWIVAMSLGPPPPEPAPDTLLNIAADGRLVPTAPFMGGRARDEAIAAGTPPDDVDAALARRTAARLADVAAIGPVFVEGPLAASRTFINHLARSTSRPVHARQGAGTAAAAALATVRKR